MFHFMGKQSQSYKYEHAASSDACSAAVCMLSGNTKRSELAFAVTVAWATVTAKVTTFPDSHYKHSSRLAGCLLKANIALVLLIDYLGELPMIVLPLLLPYLNTT